jgi:predicted ATPase/DNA-binding SARP family transcriptional activator
MSEHLSIALLGSFQVRLNEEPVTQFEYDKVRALLAYLAVEAASPQRRDTLTGLLWPDQTDRAARHSLSQALLTLRQALGDVGGALPFVLAERTEVGLNPAAEIRLDVAEFEALLADCAAHAHAHAVTCTPCMERRRRAAALYRGDFLKGLAVGDSLAFEEWMTVQRERLHRLALEALYELASYHEGRGELDQAQAYARRQVEMEPWREEAHRQLMRLLAHSGQRSAALAQYAACRRVLAEELGVEPSAETARLHDRIRGAGEAPRRNLPFQPTPFLGRQAEVAEIAGMLAHPDCRALTILGPGGMGKTRLALQVAETLADRFLDGVYFVPLAALESAHQLVTGLADALGFSFQRTGDPQAQLLDYLRGKEMLLVLDNFEHLQEGAGLVAEVLKTAPEVKATITSRVRLNLSWEWTFELEGLAVPGAAAPVRPDGLEAYSAVQLFVNSARRVRRDFSLVPAEAPAVGRICRLVEGMPLALELAAAWARVATVQEIADEIERGLDLLATSASDVPARHRSMRAVLDHSWRLLSPVEQEAFCNLSVFRGGFSREAAGQVAGASLAALAALVDQSLVRRYPSGRYDMHELSRQYAAEKRAEVPGEKEKLLDRHSAYYVAFLQGVQEPLQGKHREKALAEIDREIENVRLAWRWLVSQERTAGIEKCVETLFLFYDLRGWLKEGEEAFRVAAERLAGTERAPERELLLARLMARQARFCSQLADYEKVKQLFQTSLPIVHRFNARSEIAFSLVQLGEVDARMGASAPAAQRLRESLAIYEELGDKKGIAGTLNSLGAAIHNQGEYLTAKGYHEKSLGIFREIDDRWGIAASLYKLGAVAFALGEYQAAQRNHRESLAMSRELGDRWGVSASLNHLGIVLLVVGEYAEAERCFQESLALRQEFGNRWGAAATLNNLGQIAFLQGEYGEARRRYRESLAIYREIGDQRGITLALQNLGEAAFAQGAYEEAQQYHLESLALSREIRHAAGITYALRSLGDVSVALDAYQAAGDYYREGLQVALETHAAPRALDTLVSVAALLVKQGQPERAIELLALARGHPASEKTTQARAERLLAEAASQLPAGQAAAARARGESTGWEAAVQGLLVAPGIHGVRDSGVNGLRD